MIMRKVIRQTAATAKNYDTGQINGVKNDFRRTVNITEFTSLVLTPLVFLYTAFRLLSIVGFSAVYGLVLVSGVVYLNKFMKNWSKDAFLEFRKQSDQLNSLTRECFDSVRTIKLYGWDLSLIHI